MSYISRINDSYGNIEISQLASLEFGGTTSAFPALKANGADLQLKLADNSADANFTAGAVTLSKNINILQQASAPTAIPGYGQVFAKTDGYLYFTTPAGTTNQVITSQSGTYGITQLSGDVSAIGTGNVNATVVNVGGVSAANVASAYGATSTATSLDTANTLVQRDGSGNFAAGTITANLTGLASTATTSVSFTGSLVGDVTGTQSATVVATVDGYTAAAIATGSALANNAQSSNSPSTIVIRDSSGNFAANVITASLTGNASTATTATSATTAGSATNFTGSLVGDVTGTQGATVVSTVGTVSAANVASGANLANAATNANTVSTIVKRDGSGNFTAGIITAALSGNATTATSATSFTGSLVGDVTGTQGATVVSMVDGYTALQVGSATALANAATNANTASTIVKRDASGNFSAGTITAALSGNASTATTATSATSFTGSLVGDVTGTQGATVVSTVGTSTAANIHTAEALVNGSKTANTFLGGPLTGSAPATFRVFGASDFPGNTIAVASLSGTGSTTGYVLTSTGTGTAPTWQAASGGTAITALTGDVTATGPGSSAATVALVGGVTAANVATGANLANAATVLNTVSTIAKRDTTGAIFSSPPIQVFSGGGNTHTTSINESNTVYYLDGAGTGNALNLTLNTLPAGQAGSVLANNTSAAGSTYTISVASGGNILYPGGSTTGTLSSVFPQSTLNFVGRPGSAAWVMQSVSGVWIDSVSGLALGGSFIADANYNGKATKANTAGALVMRDASGNFTAGTVTANLTGLASSATTSVSFTGSLVGDVTGTQGATVVSTVGTVSAANVASGANLANAATNANTASTIVKRDASGNFIAGTITAALTGTASGNLALTGGTVTGATTFSATGTALSVTNNASIGGVVLNANGSNTAPSYSFTNSTNTGMFYDATNTALGFAVAGTYTASFTFNATNSVASLDFKGGTNALGTVAFMTATPVGNLTGSVGDIASWTGGAAGTTLYVKETGSATTTGWASVFTSGTTNAIAATALSGTGSTSGYVLTSTGTGTSPTWQAASGGGATSPAAATTSGGTAALNTTYYSSTNSFSMSLPATSTVTSGQMATITFYNNSTGATTITGAIYVGNSLSTTNITLNGKGSSITLQATNGDSNWTSKAVTGSITVN